MPNIASIIPPPSNAAFGTDLVSGVHSRLTKDIIEFLNANRVQLQNDDTRRTAAIQRLSRLVTAVWPRAQVKLYGSHVTGLSLPAVHKNAPAITPGVLEGRNAVNESSQKLLARRLKGESWIDPRSIKIIERTVVPVIKVSTKDARTRMLQLDISFDGPVHHGLEAIAMVKDILQQFPMVRPLVLVLKQFLFDRGLLTAYTGGLSSYGLFLMVTRFLQEQPNSWGDCGSMLMGFLDFYGNCFDPRSTGISVGRRQYFARRTPMPPPVVYQPPMVVAPIPTPVASPQAGRPNFLRRHSFTDRGNNGETNWSRPPRHLPQPAPLHPRFVAPPPYNNNNNIHIHDRSSGKSYTFDPLWVEDPLSAGNNVGRNAFRIFQVQRAFSDAHRALVASLEWESVSNVHTEVVDYPLLKCLLQSEDVFYDLDDHHR
jgi:DNA polymerase sigma